MTKLRLFATILPPREQNKNRAFSRTAVFLQLSDGPKKQTHIWAGLGCGAQAMYVPR